MFDKVREMFRRYFVAGFIAVIPISISVFLVFWFFKKIDALFSPLLYHIIKGFFPGYSMQPLPGTGFILGIVTILLVGFLSKTYLLEPIFGLFDLILKRIPIAKSIYTTTKTLTEAFSPEHRTAFREVVLIKYPRTGSYAVGFVTKKTLCNGQEMDAVYVPTNNLYLGEVLFARPDEVLKTDLSVEEGIKILASGGTAAPDCIVDEFPRKGEIEEE